eukprot:CAMPEP_0179234778 /NCGR_PEP_ID=MMETSP0797-20121207/13066_1 /TAXON_ID=47934 /ORGANISM="Dinophysis acuminata, Strain DAEP01" /LENGTH=48 /DNA_ID= /DNA_START= /DNA_END= /DNA_ORIENTATION=
MAISLGQLAGIQVYSCETDSGVQMQDCRRAHGVCSRKGYGRAGTTATA